LTLQASPSVLFPDNSYILN